VKHLSTRIFIGAALIALGCAGGVSAQTPQVPPTPTAGPTALPPPGAPLDRSKIAPPQPLTAHPGPVQGTTSATGIDIIAGTDGFHTFAQAVSASGLMDTLHGSGPYTIFAPTDVAFARLPAGQLDALLRPENRERLRALVMYLIVPSDVHMDAIGRSRTVPTLLGEPAALQRSASGAFTFNGANVIERDVQASNGEVDVIDSIVLPRRNPADQGKNATH